MRVYLVCKYLFSLKMFSKQKADQTLLFFYICFTWCNETNANWNEREVMSINCFYCACYQVDDICNCTCANIFGNIFGNMHFVVQEPLNHGDETLSWSCRTQNAIQSHHLAAELEGVDNHWHGTIYPGYRHCPNLLGSWKSHILHLSCCTWLVSEVKDWGGCW